MEEKKCKEIDIATRSNRISHNDYNVCRETQQSLYKTMNVLRSYKHKVFSETINKIALSAKDDKIIILEAPFLSGIIL